MNDLDSTLMALAEPTRRGIVDLLSQRPHRAGELAETLDMSPPAMSRHLRVLRLRGLIEESRVEHDAPKSVSPAPRAVYGAIEMARRRRGILE